METILNAFRIPGPQFGMPEHDGRWTTEFADALEAIGERELAQAERWRAVESYRREAERDG